jgi:hypothetical protein
MATNLDDFLETISPENTYDPLYALRDQALNTFQHTKGSVDDWDEFKTVMERFHEHLFTHLLELKTHIDSPPDFHWGQAMYTFDEIYGRNGFKEAYIRAQTGRNGGLYAVLREFANHMAEKQADNLVRVRVTEFWGDALTEKKYDTPIEYGQKWKHILPPELTEDNFIRLRINFPHALAQHPRLLMALRAAIQKKT